MNEGFLNICNEGDFIIVKGEIERIRKNRFAMMYIKRNIPCCELSDNLVVKKFSSIPELLNHIKVVAEYVKCQLLYDSQVNDDINEYENKERLFSEFSNKANNIRNNKLIVTEFQEFTSSLGANMKNRKLYTLQLLSAYHMAFSQNACNFSVPGAGKTSVVYGAYSYLKNLPKDNPKHVDCLMIIGPLSSFGPWENEFEECFGEKADSIRLIGSLSKKKKSNYLHGLCPAELTLTSYQSVISIKDELKFFLKRYNVMLVLDEAHKIKNAKGAITSLSIIELAEFAKSRIVLTGTPAPNGYEDLYNLYKFIWPDRNIITYNVAQLENMSNTVNDVRVQNLIDEISPFFIRVRKSDLGIPPAISHEIVVPMSECQKNIYEIIESKIISSFDLKEESPYLSKIRQAKLIRLLQVATNPVLLNSALSDFVDDRGNPYIETHEDQLFIKNLQQYISSEIPNKFYKVAELVERIISEGGKVVVWASFIKNIELLKDFLNSRGIQTRELYGATPVENSDDESVSIIETRESIVREFNSDDSSFNVIIANPFAVAESISLHKKCHNAIYLERSFNAAHFIQSKDRIHRYGLASEVVTTYYYLISENSVDETVNNRLKIKENRLNHIMESMPIPLFDNNLENCGIEDIKALIRDYAKRTKKI